MKRIDGDFLVRDKDVINLRFLKEIFIAVFIFISFFLKVFKIVKDFYETPQKLKTSVSRT